LPSSQLKRGGGKPDAPPRFFSSSLWGTIVFPDEAVRLTQQLYQRVITHSNFSASLDPSNALAWRWEANKHLLNVIGSSVQGIASNVDPRSALIAAVGVLDEAINIHQEIKDTGLKLVDSTNIYQKNWRSALLSLSTKNASDFDFLEML
jgi:hypothetical protein